MLGLLYFVVNMVISVILFFVVYVGTVLLAQLPEGKIYDRSLYYTSYNYIMTNGRGFFQDKNETMRGMDLLYRTTIWFVITVGIVLILVFAIPGNWSIPLGDVGINGTVVKIVILLGIGAGLVVEMLDQMASMATIVAFSRLSDDKTIAYFYDAMDCDEKLDDLSFGLKLGDNAQFDGNDDSFQNGMRYIYFRSSNNDVYLIPLDYRDYVY